MGMHVGNTKSIRAIPYLQTNLNKKDHKGSKKIF